MKKTLIAAAVMATSGIAFAASNVTLYGVIEEGVLLEKAKHADTSVQLKSGFDQGGRWGIKGVEDLGNGYSVGFILEQGFTADDGNVANTGNGTTSGFTREAFMYVNGAFGKFGAGRTGTLASGAQSNHILTGWALGTGLGLSSWTSAIGNGFSRTNNSVVYATPVFSGFSVHAMYSNGLSTDTSKWSDNSHYYGLGVKYQANAIKSSLIFEAVDNKGTETAAKTAGDVFSMQDYYLSVEKLPIAGYKDWADKKANKDAYKEWAKTELAAGEKAKKAIYVINYGLEYNLGSWTPMFAYQFAHQNSGRRTHMFGLSAKVAVGGGDVLVGGRYLFGKDEAKDVGANKVAVDGDVRAWNIGAAYIYPLSKRTALKAYAGYADSGKEWKDVENVAYNGYQVYLGMRHSF